MVAAEAERVEFGGEQGGVGEIGGFAREPDQPARLGARQLDQTVFGLVESREGVGARDAGQAAVERIGPGVIGADQARRADRFAALDQPRAAMAADIVEDMRLAGLVAAQQQRDAQAVVRHRHIAARQQRRRRDHLRHAVEQARLLGLEAGRVGIMGGGNMGDAVAQRVASLRDRASERELAFGGALRRLNVHGGKVRPPGE